jgi:hypothetical protein
MGIISMKLNRFMKQLSDRRPLDGYRSTLPSCDRIRLAEPIFLEHRRPGWPGCNPNRLRRCRRSG